MIKPKGLFLPLILLLSLPPGAPAQENQRPGEARRLYEQGRLAQLQEDPIGAVELYRAALKINPGYDAPLTGLAECYFLLEEYEEAQSHLERALLLDRGNPSLLILKGRIQIALGRPEQARPLFETVLEKEPNNLEARFGLAELDIFLGRKREAAQRYLESLRISPENDKAILSLALLSEAGGDFNAARAYLELALRHHSDQPQVHYVAARFAAQAQDNEKARRHLQTALSLKPADKACRQLLAQIDLRSGKPQEAVSLLREMLEAHRSDPLIWYTLGLAYEAAGDVAQSVASFFQAVRLDPDGEMAQIALENLAMAKLSIKDPSRQKLAESHIRRGAILEEKNLMDKAQWEYRRGLLLDPESVEARMRFAGIYRLQGYPNKYLKELEVLVSLGRKEARILDDIDIVKSSLHDTVAQRWSMDQYTLDKKKYRIKLFVVGPENSLLHEQGPLVLSIYLADILKRYENLSLADAPKAATSLEEAFRAARTEGTDYFLILTLEETERSIALNLDHYLSRTGTRLDSYHAYRTGNDRVRDCCIAVTDRFMRRLPAWGTLLAREFDRGSIDLGRFNGIKEKDRLVLVKKGRVGLRNDAVGLAWKDEDVLGAFTATAVDENMSEGILEKRSFFDMINPGDELILAALPAAAEKDEINGSPGLLKRIFKLLGIGSGK